MIKANEIAFKSSNNVTLIIIGRSLNMIEKSRATFIQIDSSTNKFHFRFTILKYFMFINVTFFHKI